MNALGPAALAGLWLLGLVFAAPLLRGGPRLADRARDAIVVGVAIPLALGLVHLFWWPLCWLALALCVGAAIFWRRHERGFREPIPYLLLVALALVAWPQLARPLLDGDTLSNHLPNAASWAHAHSLWTTQTRYWWYPPASELFASALYAVSSPFALGWSGLAALSLLSLRLYAWFREGALLPVRLADALAAATAAILPLALQAGSLQNDVWLAAFFVEILWSAPVDDATVLRSAALCALLKPDGWIYAAVALAASAARPRAWLVALGALVVWLARDAVLWHAAFVPAGTMGIVKLAHSTMLAHPLASLAYGFAAAARFAPLGFLLILAAAASPWLARGTPLRWAGVAAVAVAIVMPFGFVDTNAHLSGASSLRYFAPAMVAGAIAIAPHLRSLSGPVLWLLLAAALLESLGVLAVFRSDAVAFVALAVALAAPFVVAYLRRLRAPWAIAVAAFCAIVATTLLAQRSPASFYADALAVRGARSGVYGWLSRVQPPRVAGWGLEIGTVAVLSPRTDAMDVPDADPCGHAALGEAILVAAAEATHTDSFNRDRLHVAALCGRALYRDPIAIAVAPTENGQ